MKKAAPESGWFWRRQGRWLARRVNAARWLEVMLPGSIAVMVILGCTAMIRRRSGEDAFSMEILVLALVALLLTAGAAWRRMNSLRCTEAEALARLDARMGLMNRLTSASEGVGDWPPTTASVRSGFRWRWARMSGLASIGALFLIAAVWIPIPQRAVSGGALTPPEAWGQLETSLEALKEEELISPEALAALEKKLAALTTQPEADWYRQSSLEASDALRMEAAQGLHELTQNLEHARNLIAQQSRQGERLGAPSIPSSEQMAQWSDTLEKLGSGAFPLHEKQLQALKEAAAGRSKEEMQQLANRMTAQHQAACQAMECLGETKTLAETLADFWEKGKPMGAESERAGSGGNRDGGGHEPLRIVHNPPERATAALETLPKRENDDLHPGQTIMTTEGEHDYDPSAALQRQSGGAASSSGSGGAAVWKDELMPSEKAFLQKIFK